MSSEAYDPALAPLSWLFGVWESVEAEVFYPTMETTKFTETMEYLPTMNPVLEYNSETWHAVKKTKLHCERGFLRIDPETNKLALLSAHFFGLNEIAEGCIENESLSLESKLLTKMSFYNCADTLKIKRKLWREGEHLFSTLELQTDSHQLQSHAKVMYKKKV